MNEVLQAILSSVVIVALITQGAMLIKDRLNRKDTVKDKKDEILKAIKDLETKLDGHIAKDDERNAVQCRIRILRFADEMYHGILHSKEHFEQILEDIRIYDEYCEGHKGFRNEITASSEELIKAQYDECMKKHSFLGEEEKENGNRSAG